MLSFPFVVSLAREITDRTVRTIPSNLSLLSFSFFLFFFLLATRQRDNDFNEKSNDGETLLPVAFDYAIRKHGGYLIGYPSNWMTKFRASFSPLAKTRFVTIDYQQSFILARASSRDHLVELTRFDRRPIIRFLQSIERSIKVQRKRIVCFIAFISSWLFASTVFHLILTVKYNTIIIGLL